MKIIRPLRERVIAELKGLGGRYTAGGLFIPDENRKDSGIRARWARVYYVGEGQTDVKVGDLELRLGVCLTDDQTKKHRRQP